MMKNGRFLRLLLAATAVCGGCTDSISGSGGSTGTPPATPSTLAGVLQNSGKEVSLTWIDSSSDETGFRVEVNTSPFGAPPYVGVFFVGANSPGFVFDATLPNTTYFFRVYAITSSAQSDPSNVINLTTSNYPYPPYYFSALATGPTTTEVRWYNGSGVTGNTLEWSLEQSSWNLVFTGAAGADQVMESGHTGLAPNTVCYYRLVASNASGTSQQVFTSARTLSPVGARTTLTGIGLGGNTSLAFGVGGIQNIVSYNTSTANLDITRGTFPSYSSPGTTTIGSGPGHGYYGTSVATDVNGNVYVASHRAQEPDQLQFISNESTVWQTTTIETAPSFDLNVTYGRDPEIRIAPPVAGETIHIIYKFEASQMGDGSIRHAWRAHSGGLWSTETLVGPGAILKGHSFAIDSTGTLHLIYAVQIAGEYQLRHMSKSGASWGNDELVATGGLPEMNSVTVGPSNKLHVAFTDAKHGSLKYATNQSGSWVSEEVQYHPLGNLGRHNSIVYFMTPSGFDVHISYYDALHHTLWYAGREAATGSWNKKLIDADTTPFGDVGRYTSIGADGMNLYITYCDYKNARLKVVQNPQD